MLKLHFIPILKDNYVWILSNLKKSCIIIDPGLSTPIISLLFKLKLKPIAILITHNHIDHVSGIFQLILHFPKIKIYGPKEAIKSYISHILVGNEIINLLNHKCFVLSTPGHTTGHLSYFISPYLFCGDTLFSGGCGYVNNNSYLMMFKSLKYLSQLPNQTLLCYSHEYTKNNLKFSKLIYPNDKNILDYYQLIKKVGNKKPFLSNLFIEKKINIFFRISIFKGKIVNELCLNHFIKIRKIKNQYNKIIWS